MSDADAGRDDAALDAPVLDALVIGAGPAGLTASTYLARFRRKVALVDAGASRARWIPTSHNCPGFPTGVEGTRLLERLRAQAEGVGVVPVAGRIARLRREDDVFTAESDDGQAWRARCVLLATGIVDRMPAMPPATLDEAIARGLVRLCAICDAYEARDEAIAVYGPVVSAVGHAVFLRTFSRRVALVPSDDAPIDDATRARAEEAGVALLPRAVSLDVDDARVRVAFAGAPPVEFDTAYAALGGDAQSALALALGARSDDNGELVVDAHQQTSVDGLYAIGDVVSALNQISVAVGHAAIAATSVHNRLPANYCR